MKTMLLVMLLCSSLFLFAEEYKRVISLTPAVTEMIYSIGAENCLVARSDVCDHPARVKALPVAGKLGLPNVEMIVSLKADLVVSDMSVPAAEWDMLKQLKIKTVQLSSNKISDYRTNILTLGKLLGRTSAASRECQRFFSEMQKLKKENMKTVSALVLLGINPLVSCNENTFINEIIELAGAVSITSGAGQRYFVLPPEFVVEKNPEIAILSGMSGDFRRHLFSIPGWKNLRFMRRNAIIDTVPQEFFCRLSPRTPLAVKILRSKIKQAITR